MSEHYIIHNVFKARFQVNDYFLMQLNVSHIIHVVFAIYFSIFQIFFNENSKKLKF